MIKRITSVSLASLILAGILVSCGESAPSAPAAASDAPETVLAAEAETTDDGLLKDNLPQMDFGGRDFRFVSYETVNCNGIHVANEQNGEIVNDTTYEVNRRVEERFNVNLVEILDGNLSLGGLKNSILAGDDACEVDLPNTQSTFQFVQSNLVYNYDKLTYIDLDQPYWDKSLNEAASINNKLYFAMGGFDLSHLDYTHLLVFSKNVVENYQLGDIYSVVRDGKWTIDVMNEYMSKVTSLADFKKHVDGETYGLVSTSKQVLADFWEGFGLYSISKDENDLPYLSMDNERFANAIEKVFNVLWDNQNWYYYSGDENVVPDMPNLLESDRVLFGDTTFHYIKTLRTIEANFGIIPYPKWDEHQDAYHSRAEGGIRLPIVPITVTDTDFVSVIMEAISCENQNHLIPAYFEVGLKGKIARDTESEEMLNIVYDTRAYDMGDTIWLEQIRDGKFNGMFKSNKRDLASVVAKIEKSMEKKLAEAIEIFSQTN
ncbi:MAG: hypothetical protein IJT56_09440 [Clostridia bacterium]|nr:hypothetical protein [Clostridia bacterium]